MKTTENKATVEQLIDDLGGLLNDPPIPGSQSGLGHALRFFRDRLESLDFQVRSESAASGGPPVLVAIRVRGPRWVGCAAHYDVEEVEGSWRTAPFKPTVVEGRLYARGIADNLGPLLLRLEALAGLEPSPSILFVIQGEEETGSPTAHEIYPRLTLPTVDVWLEETGYCELDGTLRLLSRRSNDRSRPGLEAISATAQSAGRGVVLHDRYLNKAFGQQRCPFLTHLVGTTPYLAFGPNDPKSRIHDTNESLPLKNLSLAVELNRQFFRAMGAA